MGKKNASEVPAYNEMMCELFQALKELGGSGTITEIDDKTIETQTSHLNKCLCTLKIQ